MTKSSDRRTVNNDTLHKWVATGATIFALTWATMAYYVKSEDSQIKLNLQSQINILQVQQKTTERINDLVLIIDKKLSSIEAALKRQSDLITEVQSLRKDVNYLKIELVKRNRNHYVERLDKRSG